MRCINSIPASVTEVVLKRLKPSRFDDPRMSLPQDHRCGTCYFGQSLRCAFAETVLPDEGLNPHFGLGKQSGRSPLVKVGMLRPSA
jgi:hypothetical protein